ncbi:MAG: hypothetical protein IKX78_03045 [Clostridia bacterium]|nr:hypothetical protein [Clostridia bacterium]
MKKFLTFAAGILLLAAIGLSLASCGGSKAGETYKILGYNRTEKDVNMELRVTSDTFSFSASGESTEGGYSINGTEGLSGSLKTDGDIVICTVKELNIKYGFASENDKKAYIEEIEKSKEYMDEEIYKMYIDAANGEYKLNIEELKNKENIYYPSELIIKLNKEAKTAFVIKETRTTGSVEEYKYDESTGKLLESKTTNSDGYSYTTYYDENGNPIYDY